jgi:alpha-L-fucosidase 2
MLRLYTETFVQPNSLHVVGDFRHRGVTGMTSNMATVEGGFGAAAAINEVLLQSWNGKIRLFSGLPDSWNASFQQLRAENAFLVSAERVGGRTSPVVISSQAGAACVLVSPFPMMSVVVRAGNEEIPFDKRGDEVVFPTVAGQTYVVQDRNAPHPFVFRSVPPLTTQKSNFFGVRETR